MFPSVFLCDRRRGQKGFVERRRVENATDNFRGHFPNARFFIFTVFLLGAATNKVHRSRRYTYAAADILLLAISTNVY